MTTYLVAASAGTVLAAYPGVVFDSEATVECVILLDDDHIYDSNIFEIFIENFKKDKINYSFYLN